MADEPKGTEEEQVEETPEAAAAEKPKPARKPRAKKAAAELRFYLKGNPFVSGPKRGCTAITDSD